MLDNAANGWLDFDRERAFDAFADRHEDVRGAVGSLRILIPFAALTKGRRGDRLPFSYIGADEEFRVSLAATHALIETAAP